MASFKKAPVAGGQPRIDVIAPLKVTQILASKPVLPAGTSSTIAFCTAFVSDRC